MERIHMLWLLGQYLLVQRLRLREPTGLMMRKGDLKRLIDGKMRHEERALDAFESIGASLN